MKFIAKAQEGRKQDANMMMRGFVKIQTAKVLCLRLQCLEHIRADALKFTTGTEGQVNKMRLIDADELIKRIGKWMPKDPCGKEQTIEEVVATDIAVSVCMEIEGTPTAFDKEKVIEELQKHSHNYYPSIDHYCVSEKAVKLREVIEIVEKGGIE